MEIVDGQLHEPGVWLEWKDAPPAMWHDVLTESLLTTTDAVGVHGAVLMPSDVVWAESVAGETDYLLSIVARDVSELQQVLSRPVSPASGRAPVR